jgi:hypothetical protein
MEACWMQLKTRKRDSVGGGTQEVEVRWLTLSVLHDNEYLLSG